MPCQTSRLGAHLLASAARTILPAAALRAQSGTPVRFTPPPGPGRSAEVGIQSGEGGIVDVFLNPATGSLIGKTPHDRRLMEVVSHTHSLPILGEGPNLIIEVVAGWAILLVGSGVYLWWPS
ncbi:MAG: PepSY domain-containing protein [Caulobacter sp.]|nr:PepSY domain-containing protein [Caulobacter sp.]